MEALLYLLVYLTFVFLLIMVFVILVECIIEAHEENAHNKRLEYELALKSNLKQMLKPAVVGAGWECPVCLDESQEFAMYHPKQCHVFHLPCLESWFAASLTCPVCRANSST